VTLPTLVVLGQGYVGLPLAVHAARAGFRVIGLDPDERRVKRLQIAESFVEDVSDAELRELIDAGRYQATVDVATAHGFDIAIITVPTPLRDGAPDLSYVEAASRQLAPHVRPGCLIVLESTTYPGTTEELVRPLLEQGSGLQAGADFHLAYSPERIDPGNRRYTVTTTPKIVAGIDEESLRAATDFYDRIVERTVPVSSCKVAELTKLLENTFRHVNIALINEMAIYAHELEIDIWEVVSAASSKPFGFLPFTPGPGVGGHCLPIDPSYLSWRIKRRTGHSFRFVELANEINDHMPTYTVSRVVGSLNRRHLSVNGSRILLLGLAYKRDVGDVRESPALHVAEMLVTMGAEVRAVDPHVDEMYGPETVLRTQLTPQEVAEADLVLLVVNHAQLDLSLLEPALDRVLDVTNDPRLQGVERL
jgi:nucleotide sugar dehydrogenase